MYLYLFPNERQERKFFLENVTKGRNQQNIEKSLVHLIQHLLIFHGTFFIDSGNSVVSKNNNNSSNNKYNEKSNKCYLINVDFNIIFPRLNILFLLTWRLQSKHRQKVFVLFCFFFCFYFNVFNKNTFVLMKIESEQQKKKKMMKNFCNPKELKA